MVRKSRRPGKTALAFRNIRYAHADRFGPAEVLRLEGAEADGRPGPIAPQLPSRLAIALGPQEHRAQSEDCQVVSVFTPGCSGDRPVLVWFHGGALITGGGELSWYDGTRLASEQDIVVVAVTYRLGVFGNYYDRRLTGPSPATTDQLAAIEWVQRNIARFGGDPQRITVAGQSAGALSIEVMLRWGVGPPVVGAIFQSGNLRDPSITYTREASIEHSASFAELLGGEDPRTLSVKELLRYQAQFIETNGVTWGPARPDVELPLTLPILGGWNADDDLPFTLLSRGLSSPTWRDRELLDHQVQADTNLLYVAPTVAALREAHSNNACTWAYEFRWSVPGSPWGTPHCMELPFLFGDHDAWREAPMLAGASPDILEPVGLRMRAAWAQFVRTSEPGPGWTEWTARDPSINQLPDSLDF